MQSTKRPTVEELEKIPRVRALLERAAASGAPALQAPLGAAAGARAGSSGGGAPAEAPGAALARREADVARREAECARREAECARREAALAAAAVGEQQHGARAGSAGGAQLALKQQQQVAVAAAAGGIPTVAVSLAARAGEYSSQMEADPVGGSSGV